MSLFIFIFIPLAWALTGRLLGTAVSLTVPTETGKRVGGVLGRWCMWLFPALYFLLFLLGGSGDAGHGVRLFGSEELFGLLCLPYYAIPVVGLYVIGAYVIRDLIRGLRCKESRERVPEPPLPDDH